MHSALELTCECVQVTSRRGQCTEASRCRVKTGSQRGRLELGSYLPSRLDSVPKALRVDQPAALLLAFSLWRGEYVRFTLRRTGLVIGARGESFGIVVASRKKARYDGCCRCRQGTWKHDKSGGNNLEVEDQSRRISLA
ncbi:hypothetical protein CHU98_g100 [Xylaria longipes]|nr:hypothetical protein CHU98_g100 [Xylaria longipes]